MDLNFGFKMRSNKLDLISDLLIIVDSFFFSHLFSYRIRAGSNDRSWRKCARRFAIAKWYAQKCETQNFQCGQHARPLQHSHSNDRPKKHVRQVHSIWRNVCHVCDHVFDHKIFDLRKNDFSDNFSTTKIYFRILDKLFLFLSYFAQNFKIYIVCKK